MHGGESSDDTIRSESPGSRSSSHGQGSLDVAGNTSEAAGIPSQIGPERVAAQFVTFLPSVHLTLISVLQGVALAVLVSQLGVAAPEHFPNQLIYIDSVLVIAFAWFQYVWAFLAYMWPVNALHTTLQFFFAGAEVYAFSHIADPRQWLIGLAFVSGFGAIIRFLNTRVLGRAMYVRGRMRDAIHAEDQAAERSGTAQFVGLALLLALFAAIGSETKTKTVIVSSVLLAFLLFLIIAYDRQTNQALARMLVDSSWRFSPWGVVVPARDLEETGEMATDPTYSPIAKMVGGKTNAGKARDASGAHHPEPEDADQERNPDAASSCAGDAVPEGSDDDA